MFPSPFPDHITFCVHSIDYYTAIPPHPEEEAFVQEVKSESRKHQFLAGRACAHDALSHFGLSHKPILRNPKTCEPLWPEGFHGSITHTGNWAAAAVGRKIEVQGIGIDLENLSRKVDPNLRRHVCDAEEQQLLNSLEPEEADQALKLIFSAKECIFKAFFPLTRVYLHFYDARINLNKTRTGFEYKLLHRELVKRLGSSQGQGRIQMSDTLLLTSVFCNSDEKQSV